MSETVDPCALTGRAFRVQFRPEADLAQGVCSGRIEHLRSGDATHFATAEELLSFVNFCLQHHSGGASRRSPADRTENAQLD